MGPPAAVAVGGARVASRLAQAAAQAPVREVIHVRETFSSKKETVEGEMSERRMLAASPMRRSWEKLRHARQVVRASAGEWVRSARKRSSSLVAHN